MRRRTLLTLVLALLLAAVPVAAQAKGASAANISGGGPGGLPGGPIDLKGDGEPGSGTDLADLAQAAGVWALLWEDGQPGALDAAPTTRRGPRYTITWTFPNGEGTADKVRQSVWPYAAGGPVTYLAHGQKVLDSTTKGGWYRAADNLRVDLIALGLPDRPALATAATPATPSPATPASPSAAAGQAATAGQGATRADPSPAVWPWVAGIGLLAAAAVAWALILRRRSAPGPAPSG
jgi:hypothetical protein